MLCARHSECNHFSISEDFALILGSNCGMLVSGELFVVDDSDLGLVGREHEAVIFVLHLE